MNEVHYFPFYYNMRNAQQNLLSSYIVTIFQAIAMEVINFYRLPILFLLIRVSICEYFNNYQLIKDYLLYINVRTVLFVTSENPIEIIKISENFQSHGFWISHWKNEFKNFDYEWFFIRSSHQICVVFDLGQNQSKDFLNEISERKMFHFERNWLIFGVSNEEMFNVLSKENINVDAEVATVVPVGEK